VTDWVGGDAPRAGVFTVGGGMLIVGALTVGVGALTVGAFADWAEPEAGKINPATPHDTASANVPHDRLRIPPFPPRHAKLRTAPSEVSTPGGGLQPHIAYRVKCRRLSVHPPKLSRISSVPHSTFAPDALMTGASRFSSMAR
jgi:hypothetical protein